MDKCCKRIRPVKGRKHTHNPMVPSLPKVGCSTIEGGGGRSTNRISLSPVSSSTAGVRQRCGSLPVEYTATHPSTSPPDLTRIVVLSLRGCKSPYSAIRVPDEESVLLPKTGEANGVLNQISIGLGNALFQISLRCRPLP